MTAGVLRRAWFAFRACGAAGVANVRADGYRADIDGLRMIAVMAVVCYHAGFSALQGGYVGVDVFFVISGFLITQLLLAEAQGGGVDLKAFFLRRARRLAPTFLVVCLACLVATLLLRAPHEAISFGHGLRAALLLMSNLYFDNFGYFSQNADSHLLLHTWSLTVEEQFYIVYPVVVLLVLRFCGGYLFPVLAALAAVSFVGAALMIEWRPNHAFFHMHLRAWELLLGAMIVFVRAIAPLRDGAANVAMAVGVAMIAAAVFFYDADTVFPGLAAAPPAIGAALMIWAGDGARGGLTPLLTARPSVAIGKISYGFYLWHWPVMAIWRYVAGDALSLIDGVCAIALSAALAVATHYGFEDAVRRGRLLRSNRLFLAWILGGALALGASAQLLLTTGGLPQRLSPEARAIYADPEMFSWSLPAEDCRPLEHAALGGTIRCVFGAAETRPRTLILGDSFAAALAPAVRDALAPGEAAALIWAPTCAPFTPNFEPVSGFWSDACRTLRTEGLRHARDGGYDRVLLVGRWAHHVDQERSWPRLTADVERVARSVAANGAAVFVATDPPTFDSWAPQAAWRAYAFGVRMERPIGLRAYLAERRAFLDGFAPGRTPVTLVPAHEIVCDTRRCGQVRDGRPLFADSVHLNLWAARSFAPRLRAALAPARRADRLR